MAPKSAKPKAGPKVKTKDLKQDAKTKAAAKSKAAAKAEGNPESSQLALEAKKEQQNFVNTLKYRASKCNSTEAQQLLKAHWNIFPFPENYGCRKMIYAAYGVFLLFIAKSYFSKLKEGKANSK